MTLRGDTYGSTAEVQAFTTHLLDGQTAFNSTTRPTVVQVEKFLDRVSGVLNSAIAGAGFTPAAIYANSTAKLACDDWCVARAAEYVELTQRGTGYSDQEGSRTAAFRNLYGDAASFVKMVKPGWTNALNISQARPLSSGLAFTGLTAEADRLDPDDNALEQPKFTRSLFDNPVTDTEDEYA